MDDSRIKDVSKLLEAFFDRETLQAGGRYVAFVGDWRHIAGGHLADHSRPLDLKNGILIVGAEHPGWIQLLQMKQESILARVRAEYPELDVRGIAFRLADPRGSPAAPAAADPAAGKPSIPEPAAPERPATETRGEAALPPELKAIFGRLKGKLSG